VRLQDVVPFVCVLVREASFCCLWLLPHSPPSLRVAPENRFTSTLIPRAPVLPRPPQTCPDSPPSAAFARRLIPQAVVPSRPPQHLQVPAQTAHAHVHVFHAHPCSRAQRTTSRCRHAHGIWFREQSCCRAHLNTSRCQPEEAYTCLRIPLRIPLAAAPPRTPATARRRAALRLRSR